MRDCQSPNLNSANINFWPPGGHFAKYNSRQIFRLYGILFTIIAWVGEYRNAIMFLRVRNLRDFAILRLI